MCKREVNQTKEGRTEALGSGRGWGGEGGGERMDDDPRASADGTKQRRMGYPAS